MEKPTIEQEKAELERIQELMNEYQEKAEKYHRLLNSLKLMARTIDNSIKTREQENQQEQQNKPSAEDHKEEIQETGGNAE